MATESSYQECWTAALKRCEGRKPKVFLQSTTEDLDFEKLQEYMAALKNSQNGKLFVRMLNRIEPFIENLNSFHQVISTTVQANAQVGSLVWGSMKLICELVLRVTKSIEEVTDGIERIGRALPRFGMYHSILPSEHNLNEALVRVYESIVLFCFETIEFLATSPIKSFFRSLWTNYTAVISRRIQRTTLLSEEVDVLSQAVNMRIDGERHNELITLMEQKPREPNAIIPCHFIPLSRNFGFFARVAELEECGKVLETASVNGARFLSLHGIGGVGKTSIALEYAYRQQASRKVILWLSAEDEVKVLLSFKAAGQALNIVQESADNTSARNTVMQWLNKSDENWLLIFDNAESLEVLRDHMPTNKLGSILVTSRDPETQHSLGRPGCKIAPFDSSDRFVFFTRFLGRKETPDRQENEAIHRLTAQLGGLALGLKQIGSFIRESNCSVSVLLSLLDDVEQQKEIFAEQVGHTEMEFNKTLWTAWKWSFSRLDESSQNLLGLFSFLDPENITQEVVATLQSECEANSTVFPAITGGAKFLHSLRLLFRYGFIEQNPEDGTIGIHRVIQAVSLQYLEAQTRQLLYNAMVHVLGKTYPRSQAVSDTLYASWSICRTYTPHVTQLEKARKTWRFLPESEEEIWSILFNCSWYMLETGSMKEALHLAQDCEALCSDSSPAGLIRVSYLENTYGVVSLQHARYEEAIFWFSRVYTIRKQYLGELDTNTIAVQENLAMTYLSNREYSKVTEYLEPLKEKLPDLSHLPIRITSTVFALLALAYLNLDRISESWDYFQISLNMEGESFDRYSAAAGNYFYNQGRIRKAQGRLEDALKLHMHALEARNKSMGDHIQTAASCYRVADLLGMTGKTQDAIDLLKRCNDMLGNLRLLDDFPTGGQARVSWRLAQLYRSIEREDDAEICEVDAKEKRELLGYPPKEDLCEDDFNILLNFMDS